MNSFSLCEQLYFNGKLKQQIDKHGFDINAMSSYFFSVIAHGHDNIVAMFLRENAKFCNVVSEKSQTALYCAAKLGHDEIVEHLINAGASLDTFSTEAVNNQNITPLIIAILNRHETVARRLITAGANVNYGSSYNRSALCCAIRHQKRHPLVPLLVAAGADVNFNNGAITPLSCAARTGVCNTVKQLIAAGARLDTVCRRFFGAGRTALGWAVATRQRNAVVLLINAGADVDMASDEDSSPLALSLRVDDWDIPLQLARFGAQISRFVIQRCFGSPLLRTKRFCYSVFRLRLYKTVSSVSIALKNFDLPVLLVLYMCDQLFSAHWALSQPSRPIQWRIAKRVKHF